MIYHKYDINLTAKNNFFRNQENNNNIQNWLYKNNGIDKRLKWIVYHFFIEWTVASVSEVASIAN